jgi:hypothetical protein
MAPIVIVRSKGVAIIACITFVALNELYHLFVIATMTEVLSLIS